MYAVNKGQYFGFDWILQKVGADGKKINFTAFSYKTLTYLR